MVKSINYLTLKKTAFNYSNPIAAFTYAAITLYLYQPYLHQLNRTDFLPLAASAIAALGTFILSSRWTATPPAQIIAGAIYGFSPPVISLSAYHPAASVFAAALPWLFMPAVFWPIHKQVRFSTKSASVILTLIPFIILLTLLWYTKTHPSKAHIMPLPQESTLKPANMLTIIYPLAKINQLYHLGLSHTGLLLAILGLFLYAHAKKFSLIIVFIAGIVCTITGHLMAHNPALWLLIPAIFASVFAAIGSQLLAWCGKNDCTSLFIAIIPAAILTAAGLIISTFSQNGFFYSTLMYAASAIMILSIIFTAAAKVRWHKFRWILILAVVFADTIICAAKTLDAVM